MQDLSELQGYCQDQALGLSPALRRVATWIAENLPSVGWSSVEQIAQELGVSSASVIRSVQRMGFAGYNQFQQEIRQLLPPSNLVWRIARADSGRADQSLATRVIDNEMMNLDHMKSLVDEYVDTLTSAIESAETVLITANLMTAPLAEYMALHWGLVADRIIFADSSSVLCTSLLPTLSPRDLVIAVTFPRYSRSTLNVVREASQGGVSVLVITDPIGPDWSESVALKPSIKLPIGSPLYFPSATALLVLVQLVAQRLVVNHPDHARERLADMDRRWIDLGLFE